jgi:hypothetical protein
VIKFGIFVPQGWRMDLAEIEDPIEKYEAMTGVARAADAEEGWDSVWVFDHFHTVPTPEFEPRRSPSHLQVKRGNRSKDQGPFTATVLQPGRYSSVRGGHSRCST